MDNNSSSQPLICQECSSPTHDGETVLCDVCWDKKNYDAAWGPMFERRKVREAEVKAAPPGTKPTGPTGQKTLPGSRTEPSTDFVALVQRVRTSADTILASGIWTGIVASLAQDALDLLQELHREGVLPAPIYELALLRWLRREAAVQIATIEDAITKASECEDRAGVEFLRGRYAQMDGLAVLVDACLQCEPSQWPWRSCRG